MGLRKTRSATRVNEVVILTTAMLTFISFWRAGAIVLCDMASTAWYIGGIAEKSIGLSAPWFILAVMAFSGCMLGAYIEAASMFVRGGVYKVVRAAMGGTVAKISVSALMFDYVLTGPISSVAAGQYLAGLLNHLFPALRIGWVIEPHSFAVFFAIAATLYFWRENIIGIEESSGKALGIIKLTGVMALVLFTWSGYTIWVRGFQWPPFSFKFGPHALGWLENVDWAHSIGAVGVMVGLGHAFLGMSGLESLAQVYREMEAPKLKNLKRAALFIFLVAFTLTSLSSFFAITIIPDAMRQDYLDNLLGGLAMAQEGPTWALLSLHAFVVITGVMILSGAVNTSIVGANGVMNRLAEDGILADWFRWLHPRFGTTHRMINLVVALQIVTIILCRGDVYLLGEAYAFGVIWSFVFKITALMVLRFKDRNPREWMVPLNVRIGTVEIPLGLSMIFFVLVSAALTNLLTKKIATISGVIFTAAFYTVFHFSEKINERRALVKEEHREKLNLRYKDDVTELAAETTKKAGRILVAIRDPKNMYPLYQALETVDSDREDVVVLHSRRAHALQMGGDIGNLGPEEELLFTNVIAVAEKYGKTVIPMMVVSNDAAYAIAQAAQNVGATEVVMGASSKLGAEVQIERLAMTWGAIGQRTSHPVKVRILKLGGVKLECELI